MKQILTDIITIGDEILLGQTVDTNSAWMGKRLAAIGFTVRRIVSISDSREAIISTLSDCLAGADAVLITGGLGPTSDDITKQTLTEYFGGTLKMHPEAYRNMERFVLERSGTVNENNRQQGMFPDCARFVPNNCGTASGMWFERGGKVAVSMPGVPHEMIAMMTETVLPRLAEHFDAPSIYFRILLVGGIPEARLAEQLASFEAQMPDSISLAYLPSPGLIKLRLLATGNSPESVRTLIDSQIKLLKIELGANLLGEATEESDDFIGHLLLSAGKTLATAESCTGGAIAARITAQAGSSAYFRGSVVAYANEVKIGTLGVAEEDIRYYGAVSQQVAEAMAQGVRAQMHADYGIGVTGIAGPGGATEGKPVGTVWIAVASAEGVRSERFQFAGDRARNIDRSVMAALRMLAQQIQNGQ